MLKGNLQFIHDKNYKIVIVLFFVCIFLMIHGRLNTSCFYVLFVIAVGGVFSCFVFFLLRVGGGGGYCLRLSFSGRHINYLFEGFAYLII